MKRSVAPRVHDRGPLNRMMDPRCMSVSERGLSYDTQSPTRIVGSIAPLGMYTDVPQPSCGSAAVHAFTRTCSLFFSRVTNALGSAPRRPADATADSVS